MAVFASRRRATKSPLGNAARRRPFLFFGLPFMGILVGSSFLLSSLTQTRYDLRSSKVQTLTKEEELGMSKKRKKVDIREEYFRLKDKEGELEDWEQKRIARLPGQAEWGEMPAPKGG